MGSLGKIEENNVALVCFNSLWREDCAWIGGGVTPDSDNDGLRRGQQEKGEPSDEGDWIHFVKKRREVKRGSNQNFEENDGLASILSPSAHGGNDVGKSSIRVLQ